MKILYVTTRWPLPPITGDRLRAFYMLKELSKNHKVTLVSFFSNDQEVKMMIGSRMNLELRPIRFKLISSYLKTFKGIFSQKPLQLSYYSYSEMKKTIQEEIESGDYDLIFANMIRAAQYVSYVNEIPKIVDLIDALSLTYKRMLEYPGSKRDIFFSKLYASEQKRVLNFELQMIQQFKYALLVSPADRNYLQKYSSIRNVKILTNGVNTKYFRFSKNNYDPYRITFHGNIHYQPNTDAILYFYQNIFPLIYKKEKRIKLYIVGNKPRKSILELSKDPKVFITGRINDIRPYLMDSSVSICPLRMGAGVQNKILEAMAIGAPVVTTSLGREGIEANSGEHLLVADSSQDFADSVLELMHNSSYRKQIAEQARHLIENKYTWEHVLSPLAELLKD